jgi:N-terminal acetyltransferase 2
VVSNVQKVIPEQVKAWWAEYRSGSGDKKPEAAVPPAPTTLEEAKAAGWGVEEADQRTAKEGASEFLPASLCVAKTANIVKGLATQLALAYAIHKSFIFVRVPLTAAILPKVVRVLRGWGWEIGKRRARRGPA